MNPFEEKPSKKLTYSSWEKLYPESYNKNEVDPYTKTRIILMNGTEWRIGLHTNFAAIRTITICGAKSRFAVCRKNVNSKKYLC